MTGLVVDIVDLPRSSGAAKTVHRRAPAPAGLGTPVIGVPEGSPILLDATLISMDNGVLVRAGAHEDPVVHGDQGGVEKDRRALRHADDRRAQARRGGRPAVHGLRGAAGAGQVHDIDDESGHIFLLVRGRRRGGAFAG